MKSHIFGDGLAHMEKMYVGSSGQGVEKVYSEVVTGFSSGSRIMTYLKRVPGGSSSTLRRWLVVGVEETVKMSERPSVKRIEVLTCR